MINLTPKYPGINVQLSGMDGNAVAIMIAVRRALAKDHVPQHEIDQFTREASNGDYDHVIRTACAWVNCN